MDVRGRLDAYCASVGSKGLKTSMRSRTELAPVVLILGSGCSAIPVCDMHSCPLARWTQREPSSVAEALPPPRHSARDLRHGVVDCFEEGLRRTEPGKTDRLAYCEGSAVVFDGAHLVLASDKPIPGEGRTSVFELPLRPNGQAGRSPRRYLRADGYAAARKFEDATVTPEHERVFLTTGFDRVKPSGDTWDGYNVLLTYPMGRPEAAQVVSAHDEDKATSVGLREVFRPHLRTPAFPEGAPYFKVEGVAALPDQELLFGVRELGASYQDFEYTVMILSARWRQAPSGRIVLDPTTVRVAYRKDRLDVAGLQVGLSSLERHPQTGELFLLVSYEQEDPGANPDLAHGALGGFLLTLDAESFAAGRAPRPVVGAGGEPVRFVNKPEGLTFLTAHQLLLLFDDDRVLECGVPGHRHIRAPHQTAVAVLELGQYPGAVATGPAVK